MHTHPGHHGQAQSPSWFMILSLLIMAITLAMLGLQLGTNSVSVRNFRRSPAGTPAPAQHAAPAAPRAPAHWSTDRIG